MKEISLPVYFSCPHCETAFEAIQQSRPGEGSFICNACGTHVHEWSGSYDYTDWKPVDIGRA